MKKVFIGPRNHVKKDIEMWINNNFSEFDYLELIIEVVEEDIKEN